MQLGIGHGALRPFPWRFLILSHLSSIFLFLFKHVHVKAFSQSFHFQERFIKPSFCDFFHWFVLAYLNRFKKAAVRHEHLVPAARDHDPF